VTSIPWSLKVSCGFLAADTTIGFDETLRSRKSPIVSATFPMNSFESQHLSKADKRSEISRYLFLDFWRGFACLSVVVLHASCFLQLSTSTTDRTSIEQLICNFLTLGWVGVPMFFVISGYCIMASAMKLRAKGGSSFDFFRRRFRRIFPPYWACLAASVAVVSIVEWFSPGAYTYPPHRISHPSNIALIHWVGNLTLTETWLGNVIGYPFDWNNLFLGQAWTLCYEEQFYAIIGLLLLGNRKVFPIAISFLTLAILARCLFWNANLNSGYFFDGRWLSFAAGVAVYFDVTTTQRWVKFFTRSYLLTGLVWSLHSPWTLIQTIHGVEHERLASFSFAFLLIATYRFDVALNSIRILQPISKCGVMCYSIYLVHWMIEKPILTTFYHLGLSTLFNTLTVIIPLCVTISVAIGYVFHRHVELRFMHSPGRHEELPFKKTTSFSESPLEELQVRNRSLAAPG
jgi:peptidoglycan/LPS O-acetylase OafA/YrhL